MVQGNSLLWSKHIDAHVWSGSVVGVKEALIPSVQLLVVLERFVYSGHREAVQACNSALEEMRSLEMEEFSAVIKGENYHTVWARRR